MREVKRYTLVGDMNGNFNLNDARMEVCDSGEYVRTRDYAALQQNLDAAEKKVEKFAAQCAAAKIAAAYAKEGRHDYSLNTPDIDTYLNSVRADAIVEAASRIASQAWEEDEGAGMVSAVNALAIIEKEIRAGEAI